MVDKPQSEGVTRFVVKRVGVVGLGHMGHAFAVNLVEDGYQVLAYDRDPKRAAALTGARPAAGFADLGACNVVLTSLPDDDALAAVALGRAGLAGVLAPGAVHISTSTVSPDISRRVAEEHARHRQDYVAAPVLGNPDFARERKLFVLAGGARSAVEKVRPLLERLGQRLFVIGEDAALANVMKLAANALTATTLECMGEVLALLRKGGIDRHLAYDVLTNSLFDSRVHKTYGGKIVAERYTPRPDSPYGWPPRTCASRSQLPRKAKCQCPRRASSTIALSRWVPADGPSWTGRLSACWRPWMLA